MIAADGGKADGHGGREAEGLDDVFAEEGDRKGGGGAREQEESQGEEAADCTDQ